MDEKAWSEFMADDSNFEQVTDKRDHLDKLLDQFADAMQYPPNGPEYYFGESEEAKDIRRQIRELFERRFLEGDKCGWKDRNADWLMACDELDLNCETPRELIAEVGALIRPIPVAERLPEDDTVVLAWTFDETTPGEWQTCLHSCEGQFETWPTNHEQPEGEVTHWMPLPPDLK